MTPPSLSASQPHPWLGRSVGDGDRYRLDQRLGGGGMGDVFLATDTRLGKPVAVKLLKDSLAIGNDLDLKTRFERECAICAALKSVHIVQVSDYGIAAGGYPFYVMEYLQGQTLGQRLATEITLSVEQTCQIITQVCAGLYAAHSGVTLWNRETNSSDRIKVVHRDLKPDNIFLTPSAMGELVKIIDFGIAKIHSLQTEHTSATGLFLGTYHYASPEQADGGRVDERSDIYSLGIILYEMLAGIDPFGLDFKKNRITSNAWLSAHAFKPPQPLRSQPGCAAIPPALEAIVLRCLAKSPADRFASVNNLQLALEQVNTASPSFLSDEATIVRAFASEQTVAPSNPATPSPNPMPATKLPVRRHRSLLGAMAAGLVVVGAIGVYALPRWQFSQLAIPGISSSELALATTLAASEPLGTAAISANGQTLVSGGDRPAANSLYPIALWDIQTQQIRQTLDAHSGIVRSLSLSADGQILASGSDDTTINLWNATTGELLQTLNGHAAAVLSVALSPDGQTLVSGSADGTVKLWNLQTGDSRSLSAHTDAVHSVALSTDGKTIASSGADKTIRLWDRATGELLRTLGEPGGHKDVISSVAFSPDGQQLVSGSWDKSVKLWNATTGQLLHTLEGHTDRVTSAVFVGGAIASASFDHTIHLWQPETGSLTQTLSDHSSRVLSLSSSERSLVSASGDGMIQVWQ